MGRLRKTAGLALAAVAWIWAGPVQSKALRVGIAGSEPFVIRNATDFSGISLEIWRQIAEENGLNYRLVPQPSTQAGITALNNGAIDMLVGPISITARRLAMPKLDFTQPYFVGRVGILLPLTPPTLFSRMKVFFGWAVLSSVLVLLGVLFVVGSLIWLAERRRNPEHFAKAAIPGIASGMWFALVTLTTVGYGDKAPVTRTGRGITATWMVISLIAVSSLTASLASAFTLFLSGTTEQAITTAQQLEQKRVAVVSGTSGMELIQKSTTRLVQTKDLDEAISVLLAGKADALVFDQPALRFHLKQNPKLALQLAPFTLGEETYGFALKATEPLRTKLDVSILRMRRMGQVKVIADEHLN